MRTVFGDLRWLSCCALTGALLVSVTTGDAIAADRYYVLRDGHKVPLARSDSELAVTFRRDADVRAAGRRLEAAGHGKVLDFEDAPTARVKILRTAKRGDALPRALQNDEAVEDVRSVYRFGGSATPVISTGTMVVQLRGDLTAAQRSAFWADYGVDQVEAFDGLADVYVATPAAGTDEVLLAERLAADDRTLWANPNFRRAVRRHQVGGTDPLFDLQWHLQNTGQVPDSVADADIDAPEAWSVADGSGVLFGMFDDACDVDHEDLKDNYIDIGQDIALPFFDPDYNNPRPKEPLDRHGTAVMGLAVASANSVGVRGVAFRAKFTATRGLLEFVPDAIVASAYTFALQQNVDVHINSWGFVAQFPVPPVLETAIETAFKQGRDPDGEGGDDPRGMVILFSSGNEDEENLEGLSLASLPQVISVGASTPDDLRASFSSFGKTLNFLAPGGGNINLGIATTDVQDREDQATQGFNVAGVGVDIDPGGSYTGLFGGTSAACPIAAGVAGLILSVNPDLTATDVRIIMEHTCDRVSPDDAQYDAVTGRSLKYGYGRINADRAVRAARDTLTNGGLTWPDLPSDLRTEGNTLKWTAGVGADEFLVVESIDLLDFAPQDDVCYDTRQAGCADAELALLPEGVGVVAPIATCDGSCEPGSEFSVDFDVPLVGTKLFAVFSRNSIGRYSFGASTETTAVQPPSVIITASPLEGASPLSVRFNGNAISEFAIDESKTVWDFDINDASTIDGNSSSASYVYEAGPGEIRIFTARLTMSDVLGNSGSAQVRIRVFGPAEDNDSTADGGGIVRIVVGVPGTMGADVAQGTSPFTVELRVESDAVGSIQSVVWDLGDGSPAAIGLAVPHTYINESDDEFVLPVTATVTTLTPTGGIVTTTVTRLITVRPGTPAPDLGDPNLPGTQPRGAGGSTIPCGAVGLLPLLFSVTGLMWLRRR